MKTPIFGSDATARSRTLADNQMWNIFPDIVETRDGVAIGALYNSPGLILKAAAGVGPIRFGGMEQMGGTAYVVSEQNVYSVSNTFSVKHVGTLPNIVNTPVHIINNGSQLVIFDDVGGYLLPGGYPLLGGTIANGGTQYAIGDIITLINADGTGSATAQIEVTGVRARTGAVYAFIFAPQGGDSMTGLFQSLPSIFNQATTSGSGSGFQLTAPRYGAHQGLYKVPLPFTNPASATYQDGFGLCAEQGTQNIWQSNLFDLSLWDPLNVSTADAKPDNVNAVFSIHREVWVIKETNTEVWVNAGTPGFSFQRLQGVFLEVGISAPQSIAKANETLIWLSENNSGQSVFVQTTGEQAAVISTSALSDEIHGYPTTEDAQAYVYQLGGHTFYVCTFPSANATWVYDVTVSQQVSLPWWHRIASFSNGEFGRHWSNSFLNFNSVPLVGDYRNGNIYQLDPATFTDNGSPRKWLRTWRGVAQETVAAMTFSNLQIVMQTGVDVPDGTNPQVQLRCSNDGGYTWPIARFGSAGKPGMTPYRVKFNRLGSTRLNTGTNRVFELSSTDPFPVAIVGAEINV